VIAECKNLKRTPRLIVHGGAWSIPDSLLDAHLEGIRSAVCNIFPQLESGLSAIDAVELAVKEMELNPCFDAGRGSFLNELGEIEMDAMIMDGRTLDFGSVAALKNFLHPVSIARRLMEETEHCMLVGKGAALFARKTGFVEAGPEKLLVGRELDFYRKIKDDPDFRTHHAFLPSPMGTVGAVAMDTHGNLAAATSTGGTPRKLSGRVGDSPIIGAGTYAENGTGAVSATGWGESILRVMLAKRCIDLFTSFTAREAAIEAIKYLSNKVDGRAGLIGISSNGEYAFAHNTKRMAFAFIDASGREHVFIEKDRIASQGQEY
jgi:beta-aspartyl-peptidase (threonine type)